MATNELLFRRPRDEEIDVHGLTHPGLVWPRNEDSFLLASVARSLRVIATSLPQPPELTLPELPADERTAFIAVVADGVAARAAGRKPARWRSSPSPAPSPRGCTATAMARTTATTR